MYRADVVSKQIFEVRCPLSCVCLKKRLQVLAQYLVEIQGMARERTLRRAQQVCNRVPVVS